MCGSLQKSAASMRAHLLSAHSVGPDGSPLTRMYFCDLCDRVFRSWHGRRDHMVSTHGVAPSRRYRVSKREGLRRKEGGKFTCHLCGASSASRGTLRNHLVIIHHAKLDTDETRRRKRGRGSVGRKKDESEGNNGKEEAEKEAIAD